MPHLILLISKCVTFLLYIVLFQFCQIITLLSINSKSQQKNKNKMFSIAAKTLNSKYHKYFYDNPVNTIRPLLNVGNFAVDATKKFQVNYQRAINKVPRTQKPVQKSFQQILEINPIFPSLYLPQQYVKEENEYQESNILPKKQKGIPKITLDQVESLQFQANSPIQDRLICKKLESIDAICLSIFDGHGGNQLSDYASKMVTQLIDDYLGKHLKDMQLKDNKTLQTIIQNSIQWAYQQIEQKFYQILDGQFKTGNKDILKIGSCALTTIIYQDILIIGNSGDSQAIIITEDPQGLCYIKGNEPLSVNNPNERQRIKRQFQDVDQQVLLKNKYNKLYLKGFLEPTRSLGDYYLKKQKYYNKLAGDNGPFKGPYLSCKPDFTTKKIKPNFKYLIIASDGLWDFMSKKDVLRAVSSQDKFLDSQFEELGFQDLNKTYSQKITDFTPKRKLIENLKNQVLDKCGKKKGKTINQITNISPGQRRNYCDDISIITVDFQQNCAEYNSQ